MGQTRSRALIERLTALGYGEMTVRGELPPRRLPFAFDNGAFRDWKAGRPFDVTAFEADLERMHRDGLRPDFIVTPDIVAGGVESLAFSAAWAPRVRAVAPAYLALQDGMTADDVRAAADHFDGLFLGGTLPWKIRTGEAWAALARELGKPLHVGRVGTARRVAWARRIACDSVDSCLPLWSAENLQAFSRALLNPQMELGL